MMRGKFRKGLVVALALVATVVTVGSVMPKANAAIAIDTKKEDCTITLTTDKANYDTEINKLDINYNVYKIGTVDEGRKFSTQVENKNVKDLIDVLNSGKDIEAADIQTYLDAIKDAIVNRGLAGDKAIEAKSVTKPAGQVTATVKDLKVGVYVIIPEDKLTEEYIYTFMPYLITLPDNHYRNEGDSDDWIYDVTSMIKVAREPRFGDLNVKKTLTNFAPQLGNPTFVYRVKVTPPTGKSYEIVESVSLKAAAEQTFTIEKIPAGSTVVVTEEYSGGSYEPVTPESKTQTVTIAADPKYDNYDWHGDVPPVKTTEVEFKNKYDEHVRNGSGVKNHIYQKDGQIQEPEQTDENGTRVIPRNGSDAQ